MSVQRRRRVTLLAILGLYLGGEMALAPFLPRLFRDLFGVTDYAATGGFLVAARLAALVALPLWGLAARRYPLHRLVVCGLAVSTIPGAALGFAPNLTVFTVAAALVAASQVALLLAYPVLVDLDGDGADRTRGIRSFAAVFHVTAAVSAFTGALVLVLPYPRIGISLFAVVALVLAGLAHQVLRPTSETTPPGHPPEPAVRGPGAGSDGAGGYGKVAALAMIAGSAALFDLAAAVVRPFFTEYVSAGGWPVLQAALLFALPHGAALLTLPLAARWVPLFGARLLPLALVLAGAGLLTQAAGTGVLPLIAGRIVFGLGLGLGHVALDVRMFEVTGTKGPAYTAVETARYTTLFLGPILATAVAEQGLVLPLVLGAATFALAATLSAALPAVLPAAPRTAPSTSRTTTRPTVGSTPSGGNP